MTYEPVMGDMFYPFILINESSDLLHGVIMDEQIIVSFERRKTI